MTLVLAISLVALLYGYSPGFPLVRLGIVNDWLEKGRLDITDEAFRQEILELTHGEFDVRFPKDKAILGDWTILCGTPGLNILHVAI